MLIGVVAVPQQSSWVVKFAKEGSFTSDLFKSEIEYSNGYSLMTEPDQHSKLEKIDLIQVISLVLSIYTLGALIVQTLVPLSTESMDLLDQIDTLICFFFLYDFFFRFYKAESKWQFLKWGWIDFISSIPMSCFQWARAARVIRILRMLRAFRSTKILLQYLFRSRSRGTLATATLVTILMMIFSSIAILNFEKAPDSNIKSPEDALWWAFPTITTVGYGDKYPVTTEGRIVASTSWFPASVFSVFLPATSPASLWRRIKKEPMRTSRF